MGTYCFKKFHVCRITVLFLLICHLEINALEWEKAETITVTARREEQLASDVPLSLSVLQGEKLNELRSSGMDVRFMTNRAPSLQAASSFGRMYPYFFIRGLGNTDFDMNASQPVSVIHDGIVLENPWLKGQPIYDVQRIEVLRGPQGTLFGRNTPAGIVKVETARPTWQREGYGHITYGRFGSVNVESAVSGPLIADTLAARISLSLQHRDDWIDNTHTIEEDVLGGHRDMSGRVQLLWTPTKNLSTRFKYHQRDLDAYARAFHANALVRGQAQLRPGFRRDHVAHDGKNSQDLSNQGFSAELLYEGENFKLISLTGWEQLDGFTQGDVDGGFGSVGNPPSGPNGQIPFTSETADRMSDLRQLSQEFRLEYKVSQDFRWQTGIFYFDEKLEMDGFSYNTLSASVQNGHIHQEQSTKAWGVFAATTWQMTDKLESSTGIRISKDNKDYTTERLQSPIGPIGPIDKELTDSVPSWDLGLRYRIKPGMQSYVRVASSFRAPSVQGRLLFGDTVTVADTEKIVSLESGLKLRLWEQRLHLDVSAYKFWMKDQQLTAGSGTSNINRLINADRTVGHGLEVEGTLAFDYGLTLDFGVSYNRTKLDDPGLFIQPCGSNCTVLDSPGEVSGTVSIDGNSLPQVPEWMANFNLSYTYNLANGSALALSTDWAYRSRINFFLYESEEFRDDRLVEAGVQLAWYSPQGSWKVAAFGRNIFDDLSPTGGLDFNTLAAYVNEPPFWGLSVSRSF